jgi:hypothetical protein
MKEYKEKRVSYTKKKCVKVVCDICGKENRDENWNEDKGNCCQSTEVIISMDYQFDYPGNCSGTKTEFDICPHCFRGWIMRYMKERHGVEPSIEEWPD